MENRFGVKDLFLFLLIAALLVVVVLAMVQFDRQYDEVRDIKQQNNGLAKDLNTLKKSLKDVQQVVDDLKERPVAVAPGTPGPVAVGPAVVPGTNPTTGATTQQASTITEPKVDAFSGLKAAEKMPGFARGDWFIDNFGTKIGRLTPYISTDVYQSWVESQVLESMVDRDPQTLEWLPRIAKKWEISADGLRMKFWLRKGVEFSDGEPLTADDVLFTFAWIQNPAINADRDRVYLNKLKEIKKIDDYTVEFTFTEFYYLNFTTVAGRGIIPKHFYSKFTPDQFNEKTGLLMGSGQYKLENPETWTPGKLVQLLRNDRYWGPPATFNRIVFNEIQGEATEMVLYGNQAHDIIRCTPEQYRKLKNDPKIMSFSTAHEFDDIYGGYRYIGWNQLRLKDGTPTPTPFADKRVRQAMTYLLDRERIAKDILLGYATVASGPFSPNGQQSASDIKPLPWDEAKGKALLAEAGYKDRKGDGILTSADGKPLRFTLTYPGGIETTEKMVLFIKASYARAGILVDLDRQDWPVLVQKLTRTDFDAITLGFSSTPEDDLYQVFHSSQIVGEGDNRVHYINKELDAVIEKARTTVDTAERMKLWNQAHRIIHEDQPNTFLFFRKATHLMNKRVQNIQPATIGLNFEYMNGGIMPWFVPKDQQKYKEE